MPDGREKLKKLHGNLVKQGYELPDYALFEKDMADTNKLYKLHENLLKAGYDLPDKLTFRNDMGYGKPTEKRKENYVSKDLFQTSYMATPSNSNSQSKSQNDSPFYWESKDPNKDFKKPFSEVVNTKINNEIVKNKQLPISTSEVNSGLQNSNNYALQERVKKVISLLEKEPSEIERKKKNLINRATISNKEPSFDYQNYLKEDILGDGKEAKQYAEDLKKLGNYGNDKNPLVNDAATLKTFWEKRSDDLDAKEDELKNRLKNSTNEMANRGIAQELTDLRIKKERLGIAVEQIATKFAAKLNPNSDSETITRTKAQISNDKYLKGLFKLKDKNIPIRDEDKLLIETTANNILQEELEDNFSEIPIDQRPQEYFETKYNLDNQKEMAIYRFPELVSKRKGMLLAQQLGEDAKDIFASAAMGSKGAIKLIKDKTGLSWDEARGIDIGDIPNETFLGNVGKGITNSFTGLISGAHRILGTMIEEDPDRITHINEMINSVGDNVFGNNPYQQIRNPENIINKDNLEIEKNKDAGKFNITASSAKNFIGSSIGNLAGFVLGTKGISTIGMGSRAALYSNIIVGGYEPRYQEAGEVMGKNASEFAKNMYALITGGIEGVAFEALPKNKLGLIKINKDDAKKLGKILNVKSIKNVNKELLKTKIAKIFDESVVASKEASKVTAAMKGAEVANSIVRSLFGEDDVTNSNKLENAFDAGHLGEEFFGLMLPLWGMGLSHNSKQSSLLKNSIYDSGLHPETYKTNLRLLEEKGQITKEEAEGRIKTVEIAEDVVKRLPSVNPETMLPMSHEQKVAYTFNLIKEVANKAKEEDVKGDTALAEFYKKNTRQLAEERKYIIEGRKEEYDNMVDIYDRVEETGTQKYALLSNGTKVEKIEQLASNALDSPSSLKLDNELSAELLSINPIEKIRKEIINIEKELQKEDTLLSKETLKKNLEILEKSIELKESILKENIENESDNSEAILDYQSKAETNKVEEGGVGGDGMIEKKNTGTEIEPNLWEGREESGGVGVVKEMDLSKDNALDFEIELTQLNGVKNNGYLRKGDTFVRIKNHTPDWANFNEDVQDAGVKKIVNVTVGDFENSDSRRNKQSLESFKKDNPDVEVIDINVIEGESLKNIQKKIEQSLKETPKVASIGVGGEGMIENKNKSTEKVENEKAKAKEPILPTNDGGNKGNEPKSSTENTNTETDAPKKTEDTGGSKPPPTIPSKVEGVEVEGEVVSITHEQTNEVAKELGLPEYEVSPETVKEWDAEVDKRIQSDPNAIKDMLKRYRNKEKIDKYDQRMMLKYFASLKAKFNKSPNGETLKKIAEAKRLSDIEGGREVAKSLVARKGFTEVKEINDFTNFVLEEANANQVETLPQRTIDELKTKYDADQKVIADLNARIEKLEQAAAEKEFEKQAKKTKKVDKDFKATRQSLRDKLKKQFDEYKAAGQNMGIASDGGVKSFRLSVDMAKTIGEYAKTYLEEGVTKLSDVVSKIFEEVKGVMPEIKERDIRDVIAGKYAERKQTSSEIAIQMRDIKMQQIALDKIEKLQKGEALEKDPIKKQKISEELEKLRNKIAELKSADKKTPEEVALQSYKTGLKNKIDKLKKDLETGDYLKDPEPKKPLKLDAEAQRLQDEHIKFVKETNIRRAKAEYANRSRGERWYDNILQILGIKRIVQTAIDLSIPLRQGVTIAFNPRRWDTFGKSFKAMLKSTFSPKTFDRYMYNIHQSPEYKDMLKDKVHFNEMDAVDSNSRNEDFLKSFIYKIPILREPLLASNRAADGFLNVSRFDMYLKGKRLLERQGITRENSPESYEALGKWVMNITGRGNLLKFIEDSHNGRMVASNTFFGARLMASRFNLLNPIYYAKMPSAVRKEALKDMGTFTGMLIATGLAGMAAGGKVSFDPDDSEFLKLKFGNTKYDISGGMVQYVRTYLRLQKAITMRANPNVTKAEADKYAKYAVKSTVDFFRYKLAPNTSYGFSAITGKDALGRDFDATEAAKIYPMYVDDMIAGYKEQGMLSLSTILTPSLLGVGVQTYEDSKDYSDEQLKTPSLKFFKDRDINLPSIGTKKQVDKNNDLTELEYDEYKEKAIKYFKEEWDKFFKDGIINIEKDGYGSIQIKINDESSIGKAKEQFQLSDKEINDGIRNLRDKFMNNAREKAKKEVFPKNAEKPKVTFKVFE